MAQHLALLSLLVRDYDEALAFYVGKMGFSLVEDSHLGGGKRWVVVAPGAAGTRFLLAKASDDQQTALVGGQGGGRVWQESRIHSSYRPRSTLGQVFRQYLQYGYWKPFVMKKHGQPASMRHLVPALLVAALGATAVLAVLGGPAWPLAALAAL